jgi:hypothetical protein
MYASPAEYLESAAEHLASAYAHREHARTRTGEVRAWAYGEARSRVRAARCALKFARSAAAFMARPWEPL